jgi:hypothetical protein
LCISIPCGFNTPMHSSTPRTRFTNNQSCCQVNTSIRSLLSKWNVWKNSVITVIFPISRN